MTTGLLALGVYTVFTSCAAHLIKSHSRRICPGIHFAEREIFLAVVHMLWAFNIEPVFEEQDVRDTQEGALSDHLTSRHEIKMVPRIENVGHALLDLS